MIAALHQLGFFDAHTSGSHLTLKRIEADGTTTVTVIKLNANPLPRGTLRNALRLAKVSEEEFLRHLR